MFLHIDASAIAAVLADGDSVRKYHECIENLLVAHFHGDHIVSVEPGSISELVKSNVEWSRRAKRALQHIDENYSQIAGLRSEVGWAIEVGVGSSFDGQATMVDGERSVIRAELMVFNHPANILCTLLMGENLTDANLFHELALCMRAVRRLDGLHICCEKDQGGGSTFAKVYKARAESGRILLAIADTDQSHPQGGFGETFKTLNETANAKPAHHRARPLPVRTAEGLIPLDVYREVYPDDLKLDEAPRRLGAIARIEQFLRSAPSDVLKYAHLKDGIRLYQVEHSNNDGMKYYWTKQAQSARRDKCNQSAANQCGSKDDCKCFIVDALGGDALSKVVEWMQGQKSKKRLAGRFNLSRNTNTEIAQLADEVLWWTITFTPLT